MRTILVSFFLGLSLAAGSAEQNLVRNPSFEAAAATNGLPGGGWWLYSGKGTPQARVDTSMAHEGRASVKLQAAEDTKATLVSAPFKVAPDDEIRFEAWASGDGSAAAVGTFAGVAFRHADGRVIGRVYFPARLSGTEWTRIAGSARAPAEATTAEVHLSYSNAPAGLWFDDVNAEITNLLSFALAETPKPWQGKQDLEVTLTSRSKTPFAGKIVAVVGKETKSIPLTLEPSATRQIKVPIALNGIGAHSYKLNLVDSSGLPQHVIEGKIQTRPTLVLCPPCPAYHLTGEGSGLTRLDARINLNPSQREGLRLAVELRDGNGKRLDSAETDAARGEIVGVELHVPTGYSGDFAVSARLLASKDKEIARATTQVRVRPQADSLVTLGADGFVRIGGQPNFPLGIYNSGREEEMGRAGFNATHNYGITTGDAAEPINPNDAHLLELLDRSASNGLRMMVELPRKAIEKAQWQQVRRRVETFQHHPGLLCWGSEERVARGEAPLANLAALYKLVHELDPDHPLVLGDTREVIQKLQVDRRDFFPEACMDGGIWWWYPVPLKEPDGNGLEGQSAPGILEPPSWLTTTLSKKPLWIAIQAYQKPSKDARFPTPEEYRCQAYLSIIKGVKGLFFYVGSGQKDYLGKAAGLFNKPAESHWDYVQKLASELREMSPVIVAPKPDLKLALSPAGALVEFALREREGKFYLLAANKSGRPQSVKFVGFPDKCQRAKVEYENRQVPISDHSLGDSFTPFGVHIYQIQ